MLPWKWVLLLSCLHQKIQGKCLTKTQSHYASHKSGTAQLEEIDEKWIQTYLDKTPESTCNPTIQAFQTIRNFIPTEKEHIPNEFFPKGIQFGISGLPSYDISTTDSPRSITVSYKPLPNTWLSPLERYQKEKQILPPDSAKTVAVKPPSAEIVVAYRPMYTFGANEDLFYDEVTNDNEQVYSSTATSTQLYQNQDLSAPTMASKPNTGDSLNHASSYIDASASTIVYAISGPSTPTSADTSTIDDPKVIISTDDEPFHVEVENNNGQGYAGSYATSIKFSPNIISYTSASASTSNPGDSWNNVSPDTTSHALAEAKENLSPYTEETKSVSSEITHAPLQNVPDSPSNEHRSTDSSQTASIGNIQLVQKQTSDFGSSEQFTTHESPIATPPEENLNQYREDTEPFSYENLSTNSEEATFQIISTEDDPFLVKVENKNGQGYAGSYATPIKFSPNIISYASASASTSNPGDSWNNVSPDTASHALAEAKGNLSPYTEETKSVSSEITHAPLIQHTNTSLGQQQMVDLGPNDITQTVTNESPIPTPPVEKLNQSKEDTQFVSSQNMNTPSKDVLALPDLAEHTESAPIPTLPEEKSTETQPVSSGTTDATLKDESRSSKSPETTPPSLKDLPIIASPEERLSLPNEEAQPIFSESLHAIHAPAEVAPSVSEEHPDSIPVPPEEIVSLPKEDTQPLSSKIIHASSKDESGSLYYEEGAESTESHIPALNVQDSDSVKSVSASESDTAEFYSTNSSSVNSDSIVSDLAESGPADSGSVESRLTDSAEWPQSLDQTDSISTAMLSDYTSGSHESMFDDRSLDQTDSLSTEMLSGSTSGSHESMFDDSSLVQTDSLSTEMLELLSDNSTKSGSHESLLDDRSLVQTDSLSTEMLDLLSNNSTKSGSHESSSDEYSSKEEASEIKAFPSSQLLQPSVVDTISPEMSVLDSLSYPKLSAISHHETDQSPSFADARNPETFEAWASERPNFSVPLSPDHVFTASKVYDLVLWPGRPSVDSNTLNNVYPNY